ncbi:MAG: FAD-binding protein [Saprospirales bacterium]|nr:MAG: FAD-binding protein [Saprospirales bacterium]
MTQHFKKVNKEDLDYFSLKLGNQNVKLDKESLTEYASDETEDISISPEVVLFPQNTKQVSDIMAYCNENMIAVTPRGAGTGLSGGAIPLFGGVSLSLKKMDQILEIDTKNFQARTQPGVITEVLQNKVSELDLFYPVDPASRGSCFIGGNVAENSGGPRAVKYGVIKDYVLNLKVVLADGSIIETGANVLKNSTGYNLTQLMVGSEGTLGIVTEIVLKLIPLPKYDKLLLVPFYQPRQAAEAVNTILKSGLQPSALEFMDRDAIELALRYSDEKPFELDKEIQAHLIIELDGNKEEDLMEGIEQVFQLLEEYQTGEILFAETAAEKEKLWKIRRSIGEATKRHSVYKEEDTVVPRYKLPDLLSEVKRIGTIYGFKSVCYGHAGDGNLHINILKENMSDHRWNNELPIAIRELFTFVKNCGGTISGEHGIGLVQKQYLDIVFSEKELDLMRQIKKVFDSKGILNPGKIFD